MKKWGGYLLNQNRPLDVFKAPEIIIRHLPVAFKPSLVQLKSLVFPHLTIMKQLVHIFPVLPYASKQHVQVSVTVALLLPVGQWDTSTLPKRYVLWSNELGNQRVCLHPGPLLNSLAPNPTPRRQCSAPPLPSSQLPGTWHLFLFSPVSPNGHSTTKRIGMYRTREFKVIESTFIQKAWILARTEPAPST